VTFRPKRGGAPRIGVQLAHDRVLDVGEAARRARQQLPFEAGDMLSLIGSGRTGLAALRKLMRGRAAKGLALGSLRLLAPIPRPRKNVFCVGWNYLEHFEEGARARPQVQEMPAHPAFFTKAPTAVNGPFDSIPLHAGVTEKLDWEVELGVVIGRGGRDIAEADAMKHVYGYTVINDVSAREVQRQHGQQWFKGKSLDGHLSDGPLDRDRRRAARSSGTARDLPPERGAQAGFQHPPHVLPHPAHHRRAFGRPDPRTRRRHLHRHARRCGPRAHAAGIHARGRRP
jgi:2-keto-4-pentenoate hydratase/2-oxohepta-3-ene-1,7-dioic acid hydratase in catechol pathway